MIEDDLGARLAVGIEAIRALVEEHASTMFSLGGAHIVVPLKERFAAPLARIGARIDGVPVIVTDGVISFRIALVGRFSTGKSTLLSAVSGRALSAGGIEGGLLPESDSPCTAIPTYLKSGDDGIKVYLVGRPELHYGQEDLRTAITVDALKQMHIHPSDRAADDPFPDVKHIEIEGALPPSFENVTLADTLGADDRAGRTVRTLETAAASDAIIVLFRASMGAFATPDELSFVAKVAPPRAVGGKKVFFVINQDRTREFDDDGIAYLWDTILAESGRANRHSGERLEDGDIFVLNAKEAKEGNLANDQARVDRSGLTPLVARIADFLITDGLMAKIAPVIGDLIEVGETIVAGVRADILRMRKRRVDTEHTVVVVTEPLVRLIDTLDGLKVQTKATSKAILDQIKTSFETAMMECVHEIRSALDAHKIEATTGWWSRMRHLVSKKAAVAEVQAVINEVVQNRMARWAGEPGDITGPAKIFESEQAALIEIIARRFAEIDIALDQVKRSVLGAETLSATETLNSRVALWRGRLEATLHDAVRSKMAGVDLSGEVAAAIFGATVMAGLANIGLVPIVSGTIAKLGIILGIQATAGAVAASIVWPVTAIGALAGALLMNKDANRKLKTKALEKFSEQMHELVEVNWANFEQTISGTIAGTRQKFDRQIEDVVTGARAELDALLREAQASAAELDEMIEGREQNALGVASAIEGLQALIPIEEDINAAAA